MAETAINNSANIGGASFSIAADKNQNITIFTETDGVQFNVTITQSNFKLFVGKSLTYTIIIQNNGPVDASEVKFRDYFTKGIKYVVATSGDTVFYYDAKSKTIEANLGTIRGNGGIVVVTIKAN
ncbi:DUF11 domain-containing protein [Clostridium hydrogenum]|uniref:DUF11 domain-containing protein n=1 Tax=Clostridium hydrogenum TaxID=2855764 RepID=UPI001F47AB72|nr:DUF11 domain-containing protein [Clostridium hydrogenum]